MHCLDKDTNNMSTHPLAGAESSVTCTNVNLDLESLGHNGVPLSDRSRKRRQSPIGSTNSADTDTENDSTDSLRMNGSRMTTTAIGKEMHSLQSSGFRALKQARVLLEDPKHRANLLENSTLESMAKFKQSAYKMLDLIEEGCKVVRRQRQG
jgi:prephenate dehydrogenase